MSAPTAVPSNPRGQQALDDATTVRTELVTPAMCGPNSLFVGQLGDWTWDAVSLLCGTNAYDALDASGRPTYLSFYYFRVRSGGRFHPLAITFGDRLQVVSKVFGCGSESVLTLHRVRREDGREPEPIEPDDFYRYDDESCVYVENFNRWIARSRPDSNHALASSSPVGFRHQHLPTMPDRYSPRGAYSRARTHHSFGPAEAVTDRPEASFTVDYPVEPSRDLNGVGLLYFASYFSMVDWGLLRLWRHRGRADRTFLGRSVLDHQLCLLGNADADAVIRIELSWRLDPSDPRDEVVDAVLRDRGTGAVVAVSRQRIRPDEDPR